MAVQHRTIEKVKPKTSRTLHPSEVWLTTLLQHPLSITDGGLKAKDSQDLSQTGSSQDSTAAVDANQNSISKTIYQ
jgi:hypothetical protein